MSSPTEKLWLLGHVRKLFSYHHQHYSCPVHAAASLAAAVAVVVEGSVLAPTSAVSILEVALTQAPNCFDTLKRHKPRGQNLVAPSREVLQTQWSSAPHKTQK